MKVSAADIAVNSANQNYPRLMRLYRYLRDNGRCDRDRIMHWTGFPDPKVEPVFAYTSFARHVMRLDAVLRRHGRCVARHGETYWLEDAA